MFSSLRFECDCIALVVDSASLMSFKYYRTLKKVFVYLMKCFFSDLEVKEGSREGEKEKERKREGIHMYCIFKYFIQNVYLLFFSTLLLYKLVAFMYVVFLRLFAQVFSTSHQYFINAWSVYHHEMPTVHVLDSVSP